MRLLFRWIHVASVITAVGGIVFLRLVLMPALGPLEDPAARELLVRVIRRFRPLLDTALWAILGSGLYNLFTLRPGPPAGSWYLYIFFGKIALVSVLFTNAFALTARARRGSLHPRSRVLLTTNVILAAAIIAVSAYMRSLR